METCIADNTGKRLPIKEGGLYKLHLNGRRGNFENREKKYVFLPGRDHFILCIFKDSELQLLASSSNIEKSKEAYKIDTTLIDNVEEINKEDMPLYINDYPTDIFEKILKEWKNS